MNEESIELIEKLPFTKQRFLSNTILNECYNDFEKYKKQWLDSSFYDEKINKSIVFLKNPHFKEFNMFNSFDSVIKKNILLYNYFHQKNTIVINSNEYNIYFFYPTKHNRMKNKTHIYFTECLMKIYIWLYFIQPFIRKGCSKKMNVYIWFTNMKKKLQQNDLILDSINANSAFTTSCQTNTDIYIYRKEEWMKVFIHETFHSLGLDFSHMHLDNYENKIKQLFPVNTSKGIRLYESYSECWAELFTIMLNSFFESTNKSEYKITCRQLYYNEIQFTTFQLIKILNHYNTNYEEFIENKKVISENTSIVSYYIIKYVLLYYCYDFEKWCKKYNGKYYLRFQERNVQLFIDFIKDNYKLSSILLYVKNTQYSITKLKLNNELRYTMRMIFHE